MERDGSSGGLARVNTGDLDFDGAPKALVARGALVSEESGGHDNGSGGGSEAKSGERENALVVEEPAPFPVAMTAPESLDWE